jgi:hypothetical protein
MAKGSLGKIKAHRMTDTINPTLSTANIHKDLSGGLGNYIRVSKDA